MAPGFCLRAGGPATASADPREALRAELDRRGHRSLVLRGERVDDLEGFDYDVAVHLGGEARYAPRPSQLNVLRVVGDPVPAAERGRYDLVRGECAAAELVDACLAEVERRGLPLRVVGEGE